MGGPRGTGQRRDAGADTPHVAPADHYAVAVFRLTAREQQLPLTQALAQLSPARISAWISDLRAERSG